MKIILNGQEQEVATTLTLATLLEQNGYAKRPIAIEINREIIPRSQHATRTLSANDRIEIVQAIGGG